MHNNQKSDLFDIFAEDLLGERTVRPLIIVGASKVDHLLFEILSLYLIPKLAKNKDPDELLEGDRPLATFSARIKMCYRLGLIDQTLYVALEKLRALRNPSAHSIAFDIAKSPMREHLADSADKRALL
jgi:DNA-binding MltR family transcriptional regulator